MKKQNLKLICMAVVMVLVIIGTKNLETSKAKILNTTNIEKTVVTSKSYSALIYDTDEKLIEEIQCDGTIIRYSYDSKDRISKISSNNGTVQNIEYDGNNITVNVETKNRSYTYSNPIENKTEVTTLSTSQYETSTIQTATSSYNMNQLITDRQF